MSTNNKQLFIGLDGGGTKTLSIVIDANGNELGQFISTCSNQNSVGKEQAKVAIMESISKAIEAAGAAPSDVVSICMGISGVDRPEDQAMVGGWVKELLPNTVYEIHNDAVVALSSGTLGKLYGVVVISGTGTIAWGINRQGVKSRSAGWGPLLGDDGSGYQIGFDILKHVCRAKDESGPKTQLTQAVFNKLAISKEDDLIGWAYDKANSGWSKFAELSPLATECANNGDKVAQSILDINANALVTSIRSVFVKLGLDKLDEKVPLVLAGGNIERECLFSQMLRTKLAEAVPNAEPIFPKCTPGKGAALLAMEQYKKTHNAQ
ncbi:hypothetical protein SAMD00019534_070470 [Acytostelium subglobosum LB1]|uniref:hypothetical protein n=1 Tax=Acytostelium subglobosum LB1 TaxID=1410327 RepID=UPI000644EBE5|nr:hypothetical protein SAMD00019534_070470 [Acytostelium subglobosum LB1]GAM23872.1 hypothetical protein SAMD00019534_070470 [Acytostelium subglobosum LB1]|eukprot:XP_012752908.1 hypothetical protein SAMD00019534_070470 [Acytostelium subglobosum LB1]